MKKTVLRVTDAMSSDVAYCEVGHSMARAAELMWSRDCGSVPVVDGEGTLLGLVTDRDLTIASWSQGLALAAIPVERSMSTPVLTCRADDALEQALERMAEARVRRLAVTDEDGRLIGLFSLADAARALERVPLKARRSLSAALLDTLCALTRPRGPSGEVLVPASAPRRPASSSARARSAPAAAGPKASAAKGARRAVEVKGTRKRSAASGRAGARR